MGIPYYFSYLIKNHNLIISKLQFLNNNITNLFLDCNSLIYDSLDFTKFQAKDQFESYIIETVIIKIETIIKAINPGPDQCGSVSLKSETDSNISISGKLCKRNNLV